LIQVNKFLKKQKDFLLLYLQIALYSRVADHQIELTETGHEQAVEAGGKLRAIIGKESVYAYMSPYTRSQQTWANIRKSFSPLQIITEREDPRIREQEFGNIADLNTQPKMFEERDRLGSFFYRFPCGESGADVYDRVSLFLDTLFRELDNGHHDPTQNIIIVSHELFMRLFLMRYFRWTVKDLDGLKTFQNCEICELTKIDGVYTLDGRTKPPTNTS
jgi:broad specificity phosphatase PhoE